MKKLLILLCTAVVTYGCNNAGSNSATISATSNGNCSPITSGQQCLVTLTYNTNSVTGLNLGVNYIPQQLSQFSVPNVSSSSVCPTPSSNGGTQTCQIQITYLSTGTAVTEGLTFTLGSSSANTIVVSGD